MQQQNSILLVDDESFTLEFLSYRLEQSGFKVFTCNSGRDALKVAGEVIPNLILLDVMMPGMDGIETCLELRKNRTLKDTIITFLSARSEDYAQLAGFEAGGDDYIRKPVRLNVLLPRLHAHLRRRSRMDRSPILTAGRISIDPDRFTVLKNEKTIQLNRKEFAILRMMAASPSRIFTSHEIFAGIWGKDATVRESTVNVHISRLKKKLGQEIIESVWKKGYRLR